MENNRDKPNIIAAFDFDGTITDRDTLFDFIAFYVGKTKFMLGLIALSPILVLFKIGILSNTFAKQKMLSFYLKGQRQLEFDSIAEKYANRIDEIAKFEALQKIKWHQSKGHKVIIISASLSMWIISWAKRNDINEIFGTELEVVNGKFTGKFSSKNCHGHEKVNRLLAAYPDRESYTLYAYGDSNGDTELLALADYPFFRKFS